MNMHYDTHAAEPLCANLLSRFRRVDLVLHGINEISLVQNMSLFYFCPVEVGRNHV